MVHEEREDWACSLRPPHNDLRTSRKWRTTQAWRRCKSGHTHKGIVDQIVGIEVTAHRELLIFDRRLGLFGPELMLTVSVSIHECPALS